MNGGESPSQVEFQHGNRGRRKPVPTAARVSVDQESAKLAENGLDYEALTQVLSTRNNIMRAAMGVPS